MNKLAQILRWLHGWLFCERCGTTWDLLRAPGMTAYHWEGEWFDGPFDPNRKVGLCPACAEEHRSFWEEMWAEYYHGRL